MIYPLGSTPQEAAIGRPTPTARRLVEASVSENTRRAYGTSRGWSVSSAASPGNWNRKPYLRLLVHAQDHRVVGRTEDGKSYCSHRLVHAAGRLRGPGAGAGGGS